MQESKQTLRGKKAAPLWQKLITPSGLKGVIFTSFFLKKTTLLFSFTTPSQRSGRG